MIAIEIANQTNPERNIIQVIAVDVAAIDLAAPTIAHFNLTVTCRCSVADDEMIGKSISHVADMSMVVIKRARVALSRPAVVHHNHLPARIAAIGRGAIDFCAHGTREIPITCAALAAAAAAAENA